MFSGLVVVLLLPRARRRLTLATAAVALAYALTVIGFVHANKLTTAASAIFLQTATPLWVALLSPWWLAEPVRRRDWGVVAWLMFGLLILLVGPQLFTASQIQETAPHPLLGNWIAAGSGLCYALVVLGLRALERSWATNDPRSGEGAAALAWGNGFAFAMCVPFFRGAPLGPSAAGEATPGLAILSSGVAGDWLLVAALGTLQLGLGYVLVVTGMRAVTALQASVLLLLEPVMAPLWAWWFQGEAPGVTAWLGGLVILSGSLAKAAFDARGASGGDPG